jgi:hypothetical protein
MASAVLCGGGGGPKGANRGARGGEDILYTLYFFCLAIAEMPFNVVKYKRGWKVQDDKGNYYSKKPLTKKMARRQQKALYASESRGNLITGKGYAGFLDEDGQYHIMLCGDGWFSDVWTKVKDVGKKVGRQVLTHFTTAPLQTAKDTLAVGVRADYPPAVREVLNRYGSGQVYDLLIIREPIKSYVDRALNFITLGKWDEAKRELNYDKIFHLSMIASLALPNGDKVRLKIEKNEVISITPHFTVQQDAETIDVPVPCCLTLMEMMTLAQQQQGANFFYYDAFTNNCQNFLSNILRANGLLTKEVEGFIQQNAEQLLHRLPAYTKPFAGAITNLAGAWNRFLYGQGNMFDARGVSGGRIYCGLKQRPAGTTQGNTYTCFKKGVGVGMMLESQKQPAEPELETLTIRELGQLASKKGVKGYSKMKKAELIEALQILRGGRETQPERGNPMIVSDVRSVLGFLRRYFAPNESIMIPEEFLTGVPADGESVVSVFYAIEQLGLAKSIPVNNVLDSINYQYMNTIGDAYNAIYDAFREKGWVEEGPLTGGEAYRPPTYPQGECPESEKFNGKCPIYINTNTASGYRPQPVYGGWRQQMSSIVSHNTQVTMCRVQQCGPNPPTDFITGPVPGLDVESNQIITDFYKKSVEEQIDEFREFKIRVVGNDYGPLPQDWSNFSKKDYWLALQELALRGKWNTDKLLAETPEERQARIDEEKKLREEEPAIEEFNRYGENEQIQLRDSEYVKARQNRNGGWELFKEGQPFATEYTSRPTTWNAEAGGINPVKDDAERIQRVVNYIKSEIERRKNRSGWDKFWDGLNDFLIDLGDIGAKILDFIPGVGLAVQAVSGVQQMFRPPKSKEGVPGAVYAMLTGRRVGDVIAQKYLNDPLYKQLLPYDEYAQQLVADVQTYGSLGEKLVNTGVGYVPPEGKEFTEAKATIYEQDRYDPILRRQTSGRFWAKEDPNKGFAQGDLSQVGEALEAYAGSGLCISTHRPHDEQMRQLHAQFMTNPMYAGLARREQMNVLQMAIRLAEEDAETDSDASSVSADMEGGDLDFAFHKQLKKAGFTPEEYLRLARKRANEAGYDGRALEFSDDGDAKLMIYDEEGKPVRFGKAGYGDFLIWSQLEKAGQVRKGYAEMKRRVFQKSHSKIKGDWKSNKFSPNMLALKILW